MRILVVEDEAALSRQLDHALREAGYAVDCAADGEQADFLVRTEAYDAIVLDLGLPRVDGLTILRGWPVARRISARSLASTSSIWNGFVT